MNVKIFMNSANSNLERDILCAFGHGVENHFPTYNINRIAKWFSNQRPENSVDFEYTEGYVPCDIAVFFGSWKPREKGHHVTRNSVALNAKKFICIETPLLNRSTDRVNKYWRIGVNGFLSRDAYWPIVEKETAAARLENFGIKWTKWNNNPFGHIVIAMQLPGDASLRGADINAWAYDVVTTIRSVSNRPIVIRTHPLTSVRAFEDQWELAKKIMFGELKDVTFSNGSERTWADDLKNAYCTVTYTSGLAIDSIIAGIPTIACDPGNFAWGISSKFPEEVEKLQKADPLIVQEWLEQLSVCQWSIAEMRSGEAWTNILTAVEQMS